MSESVPDGVARLARAPHLLVALDFDGTLAPLGDDPMAVTMVPGAREVLDAVVHLGIRLALVSGRGLHVLAQLARPPAGTLLAGSHGAERGHIGPDGALVPEPEPPTADESALLARLEAALESLTAEAPGAWVEHKEFARVLHTRRVADHELTERGRRAVLAGPARWPGVHPLTGKDVVELGVRAITKGDAVARLRAQVAAEAGAAPEDVAVLFAGDDTTDELALATLGAADLGVRVGDGETCAHVRVPDEVGLVALLRALVAAHGAD